MAFTFQRLNAIVDVDVAERAGWTPLDLAQAYLDGGARFLQLRAKRLGGGPFLDLASVMAERTRAADAILIVNDRSDIARLAAADGVHLGQDDLAPAAVRRLLGGDAIVGRSTHTPEQIEAARREAITYIAVGPVFGTHTKSTGYAAVGLELVRYAAEAAGALPVVAIGGITLDSAVDVIRAGAASVAVITDLVAGHDPERRVRAYLERLVPV